MNVDVEEFVVEVVVGADKEDEVEVEEVEAEVEEVAVKV